MLFRQDKTLQQHFFLNLFQINCIRLNSTCYLFLPNIGCTSLDKLIIYTRICKYRLIECTVLQQMSTLTKVTECETLGLQSCGGGINYFYKPFFLNFRGQKPLILYILYADSLCYKFSGCHMSWPHLCGSNTVLRKNNYVCHVRYSPNMSKRVTIFSIWLPCEVFMPFRQRSPDLDFII